VIRLALPLEGLIQRMRRRADGIAARKAQSLRRRSHHPWRSPTALWSDFTDSGERN
jgi:hypothetical protein